jgi:protein gp37
MVSAGCTNCYAQSIARRFSGAGLPYEGLTRNGKWTGEVRLIEKDLDKPLRWREPSRIFVNPMSDLFHENLPFADVLRIFEVMERAKQHTFQVLTKRPERAFEFCSTYGIGTVNPWPGNVWFGVSTENQATADERIPLALQVPAPVIFISGEPLLGALDLLRVQWPRKHKVDVLRGGAWEFGGFPGFTQHSDMARIAWVIAGGESGHGARPMHIEWARSLRDQCEAAGVPYFHKQNGEWQDIESAEDVERRGYTGKLDGKWRWVNLAGGHGYHGESVRRMHRVGKRAAGSLLDGREHKEFPR